MTERCFHCDLENPDGSHYQLSVFSKVRFFCCPGCLAVAETICDSGLDEFYRYRSQPSQKAEAILPQELLEIEALDDTINEEALVNQDKHSKTIQLGIEGITCAACSWLLKKQLGQRPEVLSIEVNATTHRALLELNPEASLSPILKHIRKLGYRGYPFSEDEQEKSIQTEDRAFSRRLIVSGLAMMQVMMFATGLYIGEFQDITSQHAHFLHWVSAALATPVVFYSALPFFKSAWQGLKHCHFGMNLPVSIAILSAYFASCYSLVSGRDVFYFDSVVMFTFFLLVGRFIEHRMRLKAILKQQNFKRLLPSVATRKLADGTTQAIRVTEIQANDRLLIGSGTVVPVDGLLLSEKAELDEAVVSGEFLPVEKSQGAQVISGSTNTSATFEMQATSNLATSRLQKIIRLQDNSAALKSSSVNLADKVASGYVIGLLILVIIVGLFWWQVEADNVFPVILSLLVVSCPCALSLATPTAFAAALARFTDKGLMIKNADAISRLATIKQVYFDKTGTLTLGQMTLQQTVPLAEHSIEFCNALAAAMEQHSSHPIALAFKPLKTAALKLNEVSETIGGGLEATYHGNQYHLGKLDFTQSDTAIHRATIQRIESIAGNAVTIWLSENQQPVAAFILIDKINPQAKNTVATLHQSDITVNLLSGDNKTTCQLLGKSLSIDKVLSNQTPEEKLEEIKRGAAHSNVLMVGDGVNDLGALSHADVGICMGSASHLSKTAADAILLTPDLTVIADSIKTAKKLSRIIKQNISWAVLYNLTAIPFAAMGLVPPWLAAIGMTTSSLFVVINAMRLR